MLRMWRVLARRPAEAVVRVEYTANILRQLDALTVKQPEFTGMSPTRQVTLPMGTLPRHEYYADDMVLVKLKQQSAINEAACAEWAAALGWDDVMPELVDPALVFTGTPPEGAVCTRWVKDPKPLAEHAGRVAMSLLTSATWRKNRIFELLIWKGDDHQWNTISSGGRWWSIDHDTVMLDSWIPMKDRTSRMGNEWTDAAVKSRYGQTILREVLRRDRPPLLRRRVESIIVPRGT